MTRISNETSSILHDGDPKRRGTITRRVGAAMLATAGVVGLGLTAACSASPNPNETISAKYHEFDGAVYLAPGTKVTLTESEFSSRQFPEKPKTVTLTQGELVMDPLVDASDTYALFIPGPQDAAQEPSGMQKAGGIMEAVPFNNVDVATAFNDGYSSTIDASAEVTYFPNRNPRTWTFKAETPDSSEHAPQNFSSLPVAEAYSGNFAHAEGIAAVYGYSEFAWNNVPQN
ncbi:MAG TPA: hypothetical protein VIM53_01445 [Candidatus Saccharimonadales bacterium]